MPTGAETLGELFVRIKADLAELKTDLKKAEQKSTDTAKTMETKFASSFKKIGGLFLGLGLGRILIGWGKAALRTAADFQTLRTRLTALYGDARKGGQAFKEFVAVAATTPFSVKQVVEAGATLKAFGSAATQTIKPVSDLAAFMGTDIVTAAQAFGRAFAGGAGAADVLRERGVLQLIKDFKGIDDLTKLTLPQFRKALTESISDPTAGVAGSTNLLAQTFDGAMSNMMDAIDRFAAGIGGTFIPAFTAAAKAVGSFFSSLAESRTAVEDEAIEMNDAATAIFSYTGAQEGRVKLIRDMQSLYPNFLKNMDAEKVSNEQLKKAMEEANQEFEDRIRLQLVTQDLAALDEDYTTALRQQRDANKALTAATRDTGIANRFTGKTYDEIAGSLRGLAAQGSRPIIDPKIGEIGRQYSGDAKLFQEAVDLYDAANRNLVGVQEERNSRLAELNAEYSELATRIVGITTKASVELAKPAQVAKDIAAPKVEPLAVTTTEQLYPTPEEAQAAAEASTAAYDAKIAEAQRLRDQREEGQTFEKYTALGKTAAAAFIGSGITQIWGKLTEGLRRESNLAVQIVIGMVDAIVAELTRIAAFKFLTTIGLLQHGGSVQAQHGGAFRPGAAGIKKAAAGASFDVPYGYQNDRFPLFVESGERVDVTSRGRASSQESLLMGIQESIQALNENVVDQSLSQRNGNAPQAPLEVTGNIRGSDIYLSGSRGEKQYKRYR